MQLATCVLAIAAVLTLEGAAAAGSFVIPAGQEAFTLQMLGGKDKLPGGCVLDGVSIQSSVIDATYACGNDKKKLHLEHPSSAPSTATKTSAFAISSPTAADALPEATLSALTTRIRKDEGAFKWQEVAAAPTPSASAPSPAGSSSGPTVSNADAEAYQKALELYRKGKSREAFVIYHELARKNPRQPGVLGMVVATLAGSQLYENEVAALFTSADAAPNDPLPQFLAGVASHYYAHEDAESVDEKRRWYTTALTYLDRAKAFDFEARWYIYEAITHFRLGHQSEAEALIEKAVALGSEDPDVYYCRAEIFQRTNIPRALEDIRKYQAMVAEIIRKGGTSSPVKAKRVEMMYAHLLAVSRGEASPREIFDPVDTDPSRRFIRKVVRRPTWFAAAALAIAGVGFVGFRAARRRRSAK